MSTLLPLFALFGTQVISAQECETYAIINDGVPRTQSEAEAACNAAGFDGLATILTQSQLDCAASLITTESAWIALSSSAKGAEYTYDDACRYYERFGTTTNSQGAAIAACESNGGRLAQLQTEDDVVECSNLCGGTNVCYMGFDTDPLPPTFLDGTVMPGEVNLWLNSGEPHSRSDINHDCGVVVGPGYSGAISPNYLADGYCSGYFWWPMCEYFGDVECVTDNGECVSGDLWEKGKPHRCDKEQQCVGVLVNGNIHNDVACEETRNAVLCNDGYCDAL